jgi:hypothetical protein
VKREQTDLILNQFLKERRQHLDPLTQRRGREPLLLLQRAENQVLLDLLVTAGAKMFQVFLDAGLFTADLHGQGDQ